MSAPSNTERSAASHRAPLLRRILRGARHFFAHSLRRQLVLGIALVHAVMMTIFVIDLVDRQRDFLHRQSIDSTQALAQSLAANSVSWILANDVSGLEEVVLSQRAFPGLLYAMILSPEGRVLSHTENQYTGLFVNDQVSSSLLQGPPSSRRLVIDTSMVDIAVPVVANTRHIGWARVASSREEITTGLGIITRDGIWYTLFAIAVGSVFALGMARGLTGALRHLAGVAERIRHGDDHVRARLDRPDELGQLSDTLNETLDTVVTQKTQLLAAQEEQDRILNDLRLSVRRLEELNERLNEEVDLRSRTEDSLSREKERLSVTLGSIADGVITTDTDGRVLLLNRVAATLTGWSETEAAGRPLAEVFQLLEQESGKPCPDPFARILQPGGSGESGGDLLLLSRDGSRRAISQTAAPIRDAHQHHQGVVLVFRDTTAEHQVREQIFKMRKLESVGVLAGGIAHDFNNMLTGILGNLNLAKVYLPPDNGAVPLLEGAEQASLRARDLTQQLLTFSKGGEPVRQHASLSDLIKETSEFVLAGSSVRCQLELAKDLAAVDIDRGQISQVLQNILLNAVQAMPGGGHILLRAENQRHSRDASLPLPEGNYVKVIIGDSGIGIPEEDLPRIFDPYFTTKQQGSGLGLTICHSIISKHEGLILAESRRGEGTTFTIYLPASLRQADEAAPGPASRTQAKPQRKGRILIMDDEAMIRQVAGKMLSTAGHEVLQAADGKEALECCQRNMEEGRPLDLVIMDLTIPGGMGGEEAVGKLLAMDPGARVIVSSGYANDPVMARFSDYGFVGCLSKPYEMRAILAEVERVLQAVPGRDGSGTTNRG